MNGRRRSGTREISIDAFVEEVRRLTPSDRVDKAAEMLGLDREGTRRLYVGLYRARGWVRTYRSIESKPPGEQRAKLERLERAAAELVAAHNDLPLETASRLRHEWLLETLPILRDRPGPGTDDTAVDAALKTGLDQIADFEAILVALPRFVRIILDRDGPGSLQPLAPNERRKVSAAMVVGVRLLGGLFRELTGEEPTVGGSGTRRGPGGRFTRFVSLVSPIIELDRLRGRTIRTYWDHARAEDQRREPDRAPLPIESLLAD